MKISFNWLKEYINIDLDVNDVADKLTHSGLEVEGVEKIESIPGGLEGLVVGEVLTCEKHPNADKLSVTTINVGGEENKQVVCGAPNVAAGQKVIVATVGAKLYPKGHEPFKIKKSKIRGELSEGMICAEDEIGVGESHEGIMVLDASATAGTPARKMFDVQDDFIIEIGLTPNRADATSHIGVARDIKALFGNEVNWPDISAFKVENQNLPIEVVIENEEACHRYCGVAIQGVKVEESPGWLKSKLESIGLAPVNNIVDVTNFVLHETGQPLHAFDYEKIKSNKVVVKTLTQDTPFVTLDGVERKLAAKDLMICDENTPMCIAGVFGGMDSGVSSSTKDIFLESAYFSPDYVRKSAQVHGLKTDASFRFERGIDPLGAGYSLKRAALLIQEIAGGTIASDIIDVHPVRHDEFVVPVKVSNIDKLIGIEIGKERIVEILTSLDILVAEDNGNELVLNVPPYRVDVQREADIVEEVLRIYGFENLPLTNSLKTEYFASHPKVSKEKVQLLIAEVLTGNGFHEIITNSLTKPAYSEKLEGVSPEENVEILNKLSEELGVMRQSLLFSGLEVITHNVNRKQKNLKLFEFGKVYRLVEGEYIENEKLGVFITGNKAEEHWSQSTAKVDYYSLSGVMNQLLDKLNIRSFKSEQIANKEFEYALQIKIGKKVLATLGLLRKGILKTASVSQEVFYADIDFTVLMNAYKNEVTFDGLSKFPEVRRDLSVVLDKKVTFDKVKKVAFQANPQLIKQVNVFDVFEGEQVGEGKKSYSVSFIMQDKEKTLTEKVIDKTFNRLIQLFEKELSAIIRR